jgi:hypothetical protein
MSRQVFALAALSLAILVIIAACQDYNFNPVGSCIIQPGSKQVTLEDVSTADILFVVDDSGSMDSKQQALADNFSSFIQALAATQADRASRGLQPFDFHIAVTTSSIFRNYDLGKKCTSAPPGGLQCCASGTCGTTPACTTAGAQCGDASHFCLSGAGGPLQCCPVSTCQSVSGCALGYECGDFRTSYEATFSGCTPGIAVAGAPYPGGTFVAAPGNPKVLHFTKDLAWASWTTDPAIQGLISQFRQNIKVGSCGSNEEQHLEAARLAIQKVVSGQQPIQKGEFLHDKAKLVVVWVGDEDDCSNPADPNVAIVLTGDPGSDTCVANKNPAGQPVQFPVSDYDGYFASLGRPFAAGFVVSATCSSGTCSPATCTGPNGQNGFAPGKRFLDLAGRLSARGDSVVEGSVCDQFGPILSAVADLVKAPSSLSLPTQPASSEITVVRIVDSSGNQRKVCQQAQSADQTATSGWWFMPCGSTSDPPPVASGTTACIYINHASSTCEANPGETYSAEYLGVTPPGGCAGPSADVPSPQGQAACAQLLGGEPKNWWCYGPVTSATGTCICNP